MTTHAVPEPATRFSTLVEVLRWRATHQSHERAYTFLVDGDAQEAHLTYGQLDSQSRSIAAELQSRNAAGERVLLVYPAGLEYIAAFFGCLYAGAIAVPVYPPRPNRSLDRLESIVNDAQPTVILTTTQIASRLGPLLAAAPQLRPVSMVATDAIDQVLADDWREPLIKPDTLAFLQYTSGSTASPKGAMVSHGNLIHNQQVIKTACQHTEQSTFVSWLPMFHDMGLIGNVLQPLYLGALGVLMWPTSFLQRPFCWLQAISKYKAHTSGGPNFAFELCVRKIRSDQRETLDLSSWRVAFNGAELVRSETMERFSQAFKSCGFRPETFYPCYGLAEATLFVSGGVKGSKRRVMTVDGSALERHRVVPASVGDKSIRKVVSCGTAWVGQKIVIANPDTRVPCAPDEAGEIWAKGPSMVQGYWNRAEETERTFNAFLATTGEGPFLRTGDLGFINDGELFVTGRLKDLIIIRGHNHYPEDIEYTAGQSHSGLRVGCGVAFSVEADNDERLVVVHELERSSENLNVDDVAGAIRQSVADHHELQVHAVVLVEPGSIPKTSSGKLQRYLCRSAFLNDELKVIGRSVLAIEDSHDVAIGRTESFIRKAISAIGSEKERRMLLGLYLQQELAKILRVSSSLLDLHQPLTRLGLDSLMATELQTHIESEFGVILSMSGFLQGVTIDQLTLQVLSEMDEPHSLSLPGSAAAQEQTDEFPLSHGQRALWFLYQLAPENSAYNIVGAARILGNLNTQSLRRAFQQLVDRHASLRTTFSDGENNPVQRVDQYREVSFSEVDATTWSDARLNEYLSAEAQTPFDLDQGPLLRVSLFNQSSQQHVILLVMHHIVADFWSLAVLMQELGQLYDAEMTGQSNNLAQLPAQYRDYVRWQSEMLAGPEGQPLQSYWQDQLSGDIPALDLPADRLRPPVQTNRGASFSFKVDSELARKIKTIGRDHDATDYMTLLAAFQVLLHRYTGQENIVVGSPTAGRNRAAFAPLVGYFVNPVVLRGDLTKAPTFEKFLGQIRSTVLDAFQHQDYPFGLVVDQLRPERDPSRSPVFNVMFVFHHVRILDDNAFASFAMGQPGVRLKLGQLSLESIAIEQQTSQFDLTLTMATVENGLAASIQYNTDLFDAGTIARMAGQFETLLNAIVISPGKSISTLQLLTEAEERQLVEEWNATRVEYPFHVSLHNLIEAQIDRTPDSVAVVYEDGYVSYQELSYRANQLANYLCSAGIGPDARVGVCLERSLEMVVALLGVLKAGAAYVPIDPTYPQERISFLLNDAECSIVLTQAQLSSRIPKSDTHTICLDSDWHMIAEQSASNPAVSVGPDDVAYVIYTSGSTGNPKGVMIPHRGVCNRLLWMQDEYKLSESDKIPQKTPFTFDVSVWEFFWPLMTGASLVVAPPEAHKDVDDLIELIVRQEITTIHFVPSMAQAFLQGHAVGECRSLSRVICSGEALSASLQDRFYESLETRLHNLYGPTEASIDVTFWACDRNPNQSAVPIGRPIANTQIYVVDAYLCPTPVGVPGELLIGGVGLARGYLNRPDLTAEKFIPDPFSHKPGHRLYRTADLARYLADGEIEFLGRMDYQVKIRGFRIELGEIEHALTTHPGIRESVVVAAGNENGDARLVAYFVSEEQTVPAIAQLRSFLKERLPEHLIPSMFVALKSLPLTSSGKVDRKALPRPYGTRSESETPLVLPRTPAEQLLADIWTTVLGVKNVGVHDNFFELGGDSILSLQIISRANQAGLRLLPKHLLQFQTIAELATLATPRNSIQAEQEIVTGEVPLTPVQHWFFEQRLTEPEHYNQALLLRLRQPIDTGLLKDAIGHLLNHHDALRLRFKHDQSGWRQFYSDIKEPIPFTEVDLITTDESQHSSVIQKVSSELNASLNLSDGPLIRAAIFDAGPQTPQQMLIVIHHLAIDGVSWRILLEDLQTVVMQLSEGETVALPLKTTSYKSWAEGLARHAQSVTLNEELPYWLRQRLGEDDRLPVDDPQGLNSVGSEKIVSVSFTVDETRALLQETRRTSGAKIEEVLLMALVQTVAEWKDSKSITLDLESHGREEILEDLNLSRTVGWFTAICPVSFNVNEPIIDQLRRVPSRGIGYGLLRYLSSDTTIRATLESSPKPEIIFNYLGQVDQLFADSSLFALTSNRCGPTRSPRAARRYLLEITGIVVHGQLQLDWIYSENIHRRATIESVARDFVAELRKLISSTTRVMPQTPADEDLYLLSPMQRSLLLQTLYAPKKGMYIEQLICTLDGTLDVEALTRSWQHVIDQYDVLRTSFRWKNLEDPFQLVQPNVEVPFAQQDWQTFSPAQQEEQLAALLQSDREQGFDPGTAPLLRLNLIRAAADSYKIIFSFHHLLMDGWSLSLVLQEVFDFYAASGRAENLPVRYKRPFREHVTWLNSLDLTSAKAYWRQSLRGFTSQTILARDQNPGSLTKQESVYNQQQVRLSTADTVALKSLARQKRLSLNTLVQAAWTLLLIRYSGENDVVFGVTVSGRNNGIAGVESDVGLYINTLPLRVRVSPNDTLTTLFGNLQTSQAELHQFEYSPLTEVHKWSDVPHDRPLFETQLIFQNYPVKLALGQPFGNVRIKTVDFIISRTNFALCLMVFPDAELSFLLVHDGSRFTESVAIEILNELSVLLKDMAENPHQSISELLSGLPELICEKMTDAVLPSVAPATSEAMQEPVESLIEKTITGIFIEVLQTAQVGRHDNFYALGGDSLRALQVLIRMQEAFQVELSPQVLSATPTIAGLALAILKKQSESIDEGDDLLMNLEQLSEEDAARLLAEMERQSA